MSKQIVITKGNKGISIKNVFYNDDGTAKNITGYDVNVDVVYPDGTTTTEAVEITNAAIGETLFILGTNQTVQVGLHKLYFNIYDVNSYITAQNMINYLVIDDKGGA